jgi:cytoskeleton protein RodZ
MTVGAVLQGAREQRGIPLAELARRTKISVRVLRAIENNDFDTLPGGIFLRGFLRAYSAEVGLDPAATVEAYLQEFAPPEEPAPLPHRVPDDPSTDDVLVVKGYGAYNRPGAGGSEVGKAIAIALLSLVFVAYLSMSSGPSPPEAPAVEQTPAPGERLTVPDVVPASAAAVPVATAGEILEIDIHPAGPCWVEAVVDGSRRIYRLMGAGDRETITVRENLVLRVGDPAAFRFSINGRAGVLPGRADQPTTVRLDTDTFTDFLARSQTR